MNNKILKTKEDVNIFTLSFVELLLATASQAVSQLPELHNNFKDIFLNAESNEEALKKITSDEKLLSNFIHYNYLLNLDGLISQTFLTLGQKFDELKSDLSDNETFTSFLNDMNGILEKILNTSINKPDNKQLNNVDIDSDKIIKLNQPEK